MPFVKLDCGILNSTLWIDRAARELFITALLMGEPRELIDPTPQIAIGSLDYTGWVVPPGWYGFVEAAGPGIVHRAGLDDGHGPIFAAAMDALGRLGDPEPASRSHAFDGRRLVRVDGGFIILNFIQYREKDSTTAERSKRWRERQKAKTTRVTDTPTRVIRHQAEAEAEAEAEAKGRSSKSIHGESATKQPKAVNGSSKHPIYKGQRFVVFDWQLDNLSRVLGPHLDGFDIHEWFFSLDAEVVKSDEVVPQRDGGAWLEAKCLDECGRRGIKIGAKKAAVRLTEDAESMNAGVLAMLKAEETRK